MKTFWFVFGFGYKKTPTVKAVTVGVAFWVVGYGLLCGCVASSRVEPNVIAIAA